jgi:hypothetical protein
MVKSGRFFRKVQITFERSAFRIVNQSKIFRARRRASAASMTSSRRKLRAETNVVQSMGNCETNVRRLHQREHLIPAA